MMASKFPPPIIEGIVTCPVCHWDGYAHLLGGTTNTETGVKTCCCPDCGVDFFTGKKPVRKRPRKKVTGATP